MIHLQCRVIAKRLTMIGYKVSIYQLTFIFFISMGTLDVTVHKIQDDGNIKEVHRATLWWNVHQPAVWKSFGRVIWFKKFTKQHPSDWLSLMNEFEGKERGKRILDDSLRTNVSLLRSLVSVLNETQSSVMDSCGTNNFDEKTATIKGAKHAPCWRLCWFCFLTTRIKNGVRKKAKDTCSSL